MKSKYRIEEATSVNGEVEYRIWKMKWFGLKKAKLMSTHASLMFAEICLKEILNSIIVKKKYID